VLYGITQWIEDGRGLSPEQAGLLILPMSAAGALISVPVSRRNLIRGPLIVAASSMLVASTGVLLLTSQSPIFLIVAVSLVFGVTVGTSNVANQTALYAQTEAGHVGTAAGLLRTFGYIGSIASSTVIGLVFRESVTDEGLHLIAAILIGVSALLLAMTLFDRRLKTSATRLSGSSPPHRPSSPVP
jgi:predicted MFS family arabinose efflux permease